MPLFKQAQLEQVAQRHVSKNADSPVTLNNLSQHSVTLTVKCFLMLTWNLMCFSLCPLPIVLSLSTTDKSLAMLCLKILEDAFLILLKCNCLIVPGSTIYLQNDINMGKK